MKLVQLSRTEHGHLRINPALALSVAANVHLVPLTLSEIRKVASQFPVFLAKDGETGQFYPCALMGLEPHENLYWTGSALDADHIPLNLLRLPFFIGGADPAQAAICLDEHSPGVDANGPCAILEPDGSDTGYITTIHGILDRLAAGKAPTRGFVDRVVGLGLARETKLDVRFDNGTGAVLNGLYAIDETALGRQVAAVTDFDDVMVLAAMALSLAHVGGLVRRKNRRIEADAQWLGAAA